MAARANQSEFAIWKKGRANPNMPTRLLLREQNVGTLARRFLVENTSLGQRTTQKARVSEGVDAVEVAPCSALISGTCGDPFIG
jgi:hypothetical protein